MLTFTRSEYGYVCPRYGIKIFSWAAMYLMLTLAAHAQAIVASPNPIFISNSSTNGQTTIYASGPCCHLLGIYVNSPTGALFTQGYSELQATTGVWVPNNMTFYLVDEVTHATLSSVTVHTLGVNLPPDSTGCPFGPYTSCIDPVPATYIGGSWIEDDGSSEWTLTANNGSPGSAGNVSGSVLVFSNPSPGCPVVQYQVSPSSSYAPSTINTAQEGTTNFTWVASNPNPSTSCGGYTPVSSQTFDGSIANKGNDTASGVFTNSSGLNGPITMETNLIFTPTSETVSIQGFGKLNTIGYTILNFGQTLVDSSSTDGPDPNNNRFQGRQVYESAGAGTPADSCYQGVVSLGLTPQAPKFAVQGSVWNVGASGAANQYSVDGVGFNTTTVRYYRGILQPAGLLPCTATTSQAMMIVNNMPGYSNQQFATHTLGVTIGTSTVTINKDGLTSTQAF